MAVLKMVWTGESPFPTLQPQCIPRRTFMLWTQSALTLLRGTLGVRNEAQYRTCRCTHPYPGGGPWFRSNAGQDWSKTRFDPKHHRDGIISNEGILHRGFPELHRRNRRTPWKASLVSAFWILFHLPGRSCRKARTTAGRRPTPAQNRTGDRDLRMDGPCSHRCGISKGSLKWRLP